MLLSVFSIFHVLEHDLRDLLTIDRNHAVFIGDIFGGDRRMSGFCPLVRGSVFGNGFVIPFKQPLL